MRRIVAVLIALIVLSFANSARAGTLESSLETMIGTWSWKEFIVVVTKCESVATICGKVTKGPKNVGMEMIRSKLEPKEGSFFGLIAHPMTADIYNTKLQLTDADTWHMDGCTDAKVCASGDFKRVKK